MLRAMRTLQSLLLISPVLLGQPALAEPCLTQETLAVVQRRLGEVPASVFLAGTGLGLCNPGPSYDSQLRIQRINQLTNQAEMNPEQLSCPSSPQAASAPSGFSLTPEAAYPTASGASKVCSCTRYKEALREAQAALRSRSQ
jgi:hypothetical protein